MKSKEEFVLDYFRKNPDEEFWNGYQFSEKIHRYHKRRDGAPYLVHPFDVDYTFLILGIKNPTDHAAGMCHDTVEESLEKDNKEITQEEIAKEVSLETARRVIKVTKPKGLDFVGLVDYYNEIGKEPCLVMLKMADKFVNLRRSMFGVFTSQKIGEASFETQYLLLPQSEKIISMAEADIDFPGKEEYQKYALPLRMLRSAIKGILRGADFSVSLTNQILQLEKEKRELEEKIDH